MAVRLHVFGASGAGTTSLAAALAERCGWLHLDTDNFYWLPSEPPYRFKREPQQRVEQIRASAAQANDWILSGSLCSWGETLVPLFTHAVFLQLDDAERMQRLAARERQRYGERVLPGGDMHAQSLAFLEWAAGYQQGDLQTRSLRMHEAWIAGQLRCPLLRLDSTCESPERLAGKVIDWLAAPA
ncbi:adenylate kinase [Pseudomonas straminea]|uniref:Adenylate kinase n=1 Tax=Pseudomonas straminea TaxID=47882 RepID=A0A1I1Z2C6_PSEOC|nr:AAA family ATPase [Pseudomonas straminea]GLX16120.1 adenylate kinase [Pseudomonas straminea]SFE25891.1 Adenylate kinase [Pseudomonas straminea]